MAGVCGATRKVLFPAAYSICAHLAKTCTSFLHEIPRDTNYDMIIGSVVAFIYSPNLPQNEIVSREGGASFT